MFVSQKFILQAAACFKQFLTSGILLWIIAICSPVSMYIDQSACVTRRRGSWFSYHKNVFIYMKNEYVAILLLYKILNTLIIATWVENELVQ